jgi:hypothetical protein
LPQKSPFHAKFDFKSRFKIIDLRSSKVWIFNTELETLGSTTTTTNTTNNLDVVTITKEPLQKQRPHPEATRSSTTTESSADTSVKTDRELSVDENGKIKPYVDFSHFHEQWHLQFD